MDYFKKTVHCFCKNTETLNPQDSYLERLGPDFVMNTDMSSMHFCNKAFHASTALCQKTTVLCRTIFQLSMTLRQSECVKWLALMLCHQLVQAVNLSGQALLLSHLVPHLSITPSLTLPLILPLFYVTLSNYCSCSPANNDSKCKMFFCCHRNVTPNQVYRVIQSIQLKCIWPISALQCLLVQCKKYQS